MPVLVLPLLTKNKPGGPEFFALGLDSKDTGLSSGVPVTLSVDSGPRESSGDGMDDTDEKRPSVPSPCIGAGEAESTVS